MLDYPAAVIPPVICNGVLVAEQEGRSHWKELGLHILDSPHRVGDQALS